MECKGGMPSTNCPKLTRVDTKSQQIIAVIFSASDATDTFAVITAAVNICEEKSIKRTNKMRVSFLYFCAYCNNFFTV